MRRHRMLVASLVLAASLAGCMDPSSQGQASLYLTGEDPDAMQEVHLRVTEAHVRQADGERANASQESGDTRGEVAEGQMVVFSQHRDGDESELPRFEEAAGWVQVVNAPEGIEVGFDPGAANRSTFLGEETVPVGEYDEVGLLVDHVTALDEQGNETDVRITDQGARTNASFTVDTDEEARIVLSLAVDESLSEDEGGELRFAPTFEDTRVQMLADEDSGDEQHEQGEATELETDGG